MSIGIWLAGAIFVIVTIVAFAWVVRALLGVQFTMLRLTIAGGISFLCFTPILNGIVDVDNVEQQGLFPGLWFFLLATMLALICGMVFLVIAEALIPSNTLPGPAYLIRAARQSWSRTGRYWQITRILFRRGLTAYVSGGRRRELTTHEGRRLVAERLRFALSDGGVTFVKLGQILSTRPDLLPEEFIEELSHLQHQAPTLPWDEIEATLTAELGDLDQHFASIDHQPLAAASIAQVHTAHLVTGEEVVIKVRRPGIVSQVNVDLDIIIRLARTLEQRTTWGRRIGVVDLANGFATALREELDFRVEARNLQIVQAGAAARNDSTGLYIPVVYLPLCTQRVLVMERIKGIPISKAGSVIDERRLDRQALARDLLDSLLRQMVIDGTFHADPHPGNVMLLENNRLTLLDFGSVGRMDPVVRDALIRLILTFQREDPITATDALLELVEPTPQIDEWRLERSLGQFMVRYLAPGVPPDARMVPALFRLLSDHNLSALPEVAAAFRAIATLDGTLSSLAPGFNAITEAKSFGEQYLLEQLHPKALTQTIVSELIAVLPMVRRLPRRIDKLTEQMEAGRMNVNVRTLGDSDEQQAVNSLLNRFLSALIACTAGIIAAVMLGESGGPSVTDSVSLYQLIGYAFLIAALILSLRVLVGVFRPGDNRPSR